MCCRIFSSIPNSDLIAFQNLLHVPWGGGCSLPHCGRPRLTLTLLTRSRVPSLLPLSSAHSGLPATWEFQWFLSFATWMDGRPINFTLCMHCPQCTPAEVSLTLLPVLPVDPGTKQNTCDSGLTKFFNKVYKNASLRIIFRAWVAFLFHLQWKYKIISTHTQMHSELQWLSLYRTALDTVGTAGKWRQPQQVTAQMIFFFFQKQLTGSKAISMKLFPWLSKVEICILN